MAKIVDITEKLTFEENPRIRVMDVELEVNADAENVIKLMGLFNDGFEISPASLSEMCSLVFTEEANKKIADMHLKFKDYQELITQAADLAVGVEEDEKSGEGQTPDMTS